MPRDTIALNEREQKCYSIGVTKAPCVAVITYPGSNADWDALYALEHCAHVKVKSVFHQERTLGEVDAVVIPGGFSYGDYLRSGAIARFSAISEAVARFAAQGKPVLGICNGFQILTELGLLPGALTRNAGLRFICRDIFVRSETMGAFGGQDMQGKVLRMPVAHGDGRYVCDEQTLAGLKTKGQIAFRYCDAQGQLSDNANINGSNDHIAGIYNANKNVLGLMPHPERASDSRLGSVDGLRLFKAMIAFLAARDPEAVHP